MELRPANSLSKKTTMVQTIISFVLLMVICVMSFGTIFSVGIEVDDAFEKRLDEIMEVFEADDVEINTDMDVDFIFMIKSFASVGDVMKAVTKTGTASNEEELGEGLEDMAEKLQDEDFINFMVLVVLIVVSFSGNVLLGVGNLFLVGMALALPITAIVAAIKAIVALIKYREDMSTAFHKISKAFYDVIAVFPMLLMVLLLAPDVRLGTPVYVILGCCCGGLAVNFVGSRVKKYPGEEVRFLNLMQLLCLLGLVGYAVFFFTVMKAGLMNAAADSLKLNMLGGIDAIIDGGKIDYVAIFLNVFLVASVFSAIDNLTSLLTRAACMSKRKSAVSMGSAILSLFIVILPFVMQSMDIDFELPKDSSTFYITCVGLVVMAVAEFLQAGMPKSVCPNVSDTRRKEIVAGMDPAPVVVAAAAPYGAPAAPYGAPAAYNPYGAPAQPAAPYNPYAAPTQPAAPYNPYAAPAQPAAPYNPYAAPAAPAQPAVAYNPYAAPVAPVQPVAPVAPVEEAPVVAAPVEEVPVEVAPVEEVPVEAAPVEETPVEETSAAETPTEETV